MDERATEVITLKTLPDATAQDVFDQAARHLLAQKQAAMDDASGVCYYRKGELMCVAGRFIADDEYDEAIELRGWLELVGDGQVPAAHGELLNSLQGVHDLTSADAWRGELLEIADQYELNTNVFAGL